MSAQRFEVESERGSCLLFEAEWESLGPDSRVNFAESCKQLGINREQDHQEERSHEVHVHPWVLFQRVAFQLSTGAGDANLRV